jgi:hypothetical protein
MTDQPPAPKPVKTRHVNLRGVAKWARDLGPYALVLTVFVVTAHCTLNPTAAHYADELFTLGLVLIRTTNPPAPPPIP